MPKSRVDPPPWTAAADAYPASWFRIASDPTVYKPPPPRSRESRHDSKRAFASIGRRFRTAESRIHICCNNSSLADSLLERACGRSTAAPGTASPRIVNHRFAVAAEGDRYRPLSLTVGTVPRRRLDTETPARRVRLAG